MVRRHMISVETKESGKTQRTIELVKTKSSQWTDDRGQEDKGQDDREARNKKVESRDAQQTHRKSMFEYMFGSGTQSDEKREDDEDDFSETSSISGSSISTDGEDFWTKQRGQTVEDSGSEDTELREFDNDLRQKHTHACKYLRNGKFPKALKKFEQILSLLLERYGETHHRVGAALHNVGIANLRAGRLDDAMDAIEEAVRIRKLTLGKEHPKVADSLVELGIILLSLKEYSDSMDIFEEALELREAEADELNEAEEIAESNLKIAKLLNNIGCVNFERGNFAEAKEAFEDAITMQKDSLGELKNNEQHIKDPTSRPGFLTMASTMCNKGYIELEQKIYFRATETFAESLKIQEALLGSDNKLILSTQDNLGYAQAMNGDFEKALATYSKLRESYKECYGETHKDFMLVLKKIAYVQCNLESYEGALKTLGELEDIQFKVYEPDSRHVLETQQLMGAVNYQVLKYPSIICGACHDEDDSGIDLSYWKPKSPNNGSKMSGHRVTYA